jgi:hypothetical protein
MHKRYGQYDEKECRDAGQAFILILLIVAYFLGLTALLPWIITAMLLLMLWPAAYRPFAWFWFSFSLALGRLSSLVLLTIIYGVFVIPVGLFRRAIGKDALQLRGFRKGRGSVMHIRDHTFGPSDLEQLY